MAGEAQGANIFQVAFATAFAHGKNMVGIPQTSPIHRL